MHTYHRTKQFGVYNDITTSDTNALEKDLHGPERNQWGIHGAKAPRFPAGPSTMEVSVPLTKTRCHDEPFKSSTADQAVANGEARVFCEIISFVYKPASTCIPPPSISLLAAA
ncbi:hypothetical protein DHEL01_v211374 [Diaporthe helianthi]|uniref:Uncharacterized protein n=1 Tax=Diaporthe helianthi TaxID=158607 RepID=A0A2P5HJ19_DIAHE|nr:hypothetical protein DHEL01_v211374 [Diaporthe helianthi]